MEAFTRTEATEVLTMDDYGAIRRAHRDGKSIRKIARVFGHSRITIRKALEHPHRAAAARNRSAPKLGPFHGIIDQILQDDETAPPSSDIPRRRSTGGCATNMATAAVTPRCNAMSSHTAATNERPSFRWGTCRANASKRISVTSTLIFPRAASSSRSW